MLGELIEEQTQKTAKLLGIPTDFIKKDYYVTQAIQTLTHVEDEYFSLVFQGGTSLSKAYQVISRLSEDVDFRVILKNPTTQISKDIRRKRLRNFRHTLIQALSKTHFSVPKDQIKVFYEGRFMSISAIFEGAAKLSYLKPHIAIECFVGDLALPPQMTSVTSLIKTTLGSECTHDTFSVPCTALDETAAEKWVALTRRIANTQEKKRISDNTLVRHLYDLHQLHYNKSLTGEYRHIVKAIIEKERTMFKKQNHAYLQDPLLISKKALDMLSNEPKWQEYWVVFLEQMVYSKNKPSFTQALNELHLFNQNILPETLQ